MVDPNEYIKALSKTTPVKPVLTASEISEKQKAFDKAFSEHVEKVMGQYYSGINAAKKEDIMPTFQSQKAKGIFHLTKTRNNWFSQPKAQFYPQQVITKFPVFARPCPTVPRHGFVDSRLVKDKAELKALAAEIEKTGEPVQIVCMPFIQADYSGIVNPSGVTFGKGHDGATSGTSARFVPCSANNATFQRELSFVGSEIGINKPDVAYGEFVGLFKDDKSTLVQLRGGPHVAGTTNFVPKDTLVTDVVLAEGDLLDWEVKATQFKPGTVVWHPNGALSSHYAVHCIIHNIPVLCTDKAPVIGQIIRKESDIPALTASDYNVLAQYLATAVHQSVHGDGRSDRLRTAVATLHSQALWGNQDHLLQLRALGAAATFRYAAAACYGELRHCKCHGPDDGTLETPIPWDSCHTYSRNFVFTQIYNHNIRAVLEAFPCVERDFHKKGWGHAFGGKKWANCAKATLRLGLGIQQFLHHKNKKAWNELIAGWNETINAVHNGGGLLTKHINIHFLDSVARTPFVGFVNPYAAKVALGILTLDRNKKPGKVLPLHSRKSALELYPFRNDAGKFKKVIVDRHSITGLFEVQIHKTTWDSGQFVLTFPHLTSANNHTEPLILNSYAEVCKKATHTKEKVKAKFYRGHLQYLVIGGIIHKNS